MITDNGKAQLTVSNVTEHLNLMDFDTVNNRNIGANESSKCGLHLNDWGNGKLDINFIRKIKNLRKN